MGNVIKIKRKTGVVGAGLSAAEPALRDLTGGAGELYIGNLAGVSNILIGSSDVARKSGAVFTGTLELAPSEQSADADAATRDFVDGLATGNRETKDSVVLSTVTGVPLHGISAYTYVAGVITANANGVFPVLDEVQLLINERILLKDETTAAYNGIYTLTAAGVVGVSPWELTRATDSDTAAENKRGQFCWIDTGTVNTKTGWLQNSADVVTLGTDGITFVKVSGTTLVEADESTLTKTVDTLSVKAAGITGVQIATAALGNGLTGGNGTPIVVNADASTLEINGASAVAIKAGGVTSTQLNTSVAGNGFSAGGGGAALAVGAGTGVIVNANDIGVDFGDIMGKAIQGGAIISGGTWA